MTDQSEVKNVNTQGNTAAAGRVSPELAKPLRTWSHLAANKRRPTEYDIVSTNLLWSTDDPEAPFAMGNEAAIPAWILRHRNGSPIKHSDWNSFRDPDRTIYRTYTAVQDGQESYVDGLLSDHAKNEHDLSLPKEWIQKLSDLYTPARFMIHAVQMSSAYQVTMAPSSTVENCFIFQAGDQLRWVSRIAYRTAELKNEFPELGFASDERKIWEQSPAWQGFRELCERALVAWDWAEQFVAVNLVLKPAIDGAFIGGLAQAARRQGDSLTALLLDAQALDSERTKRWTEALVKFICDSGETGNRAQLDQWLTKWVGLGEAAVAAYLQEIDSTGAAASAANAQAAAWRKSMGLAI